MDDIIRLISQILAVPAVTSVVASAVWNLIRKPRLCVEVSRDNPRVSSNKNLYGLYSVDVINRGRFLVPTSTAYECTARVTFRDVRGRELVRVETGKWARGLEPITLHLLKTKVLKIPYEALVPSAQYVNVRCGIPEPLILLVKFEGDEDIYAFSPLSYVEGFRSDTFKVGGIGRYMCEIAVSCENTSGRFTFTIDNRGKGIYDVIIRRAHSLTSTMTTS